MSATGRGAPAQSATADREIVISRLRDEAVEKYHAIEGGPQTLSNLAAYVTEIVHGRDSTRNSWRCSRKGSGRYTRKPGGWRTSTLPTASTI